MNTLTITGNLADAPELRFTAGGKAVAGFRIAHTPRRFDKARDEWVDGTTLWLRCDVWGAKAEAVAELGKGATVMVTGRLAQQEWETKDGEKRTAVTVVVDEVAAVVKAAGRSEEAPF